MTAEMEPREFGKIDGELDEVAKKRYREKLDRIVSNVSDPYVLSKNSSVEFFPSIEWPDVYNYLVNTPSPYTKESLKAYKSLDAYNFVKSGWVGDVLSFPANADSTNFFVTASVRHSQTVSADNSEALGSRGEGRNRDLCAL